MGGSGTRRNPDGGNVKAVRASLIVVILLNLALLAVSGP